MKVPCFECNRTATHNHHVIPKSLGGIRTVPLCNECHGKIHGLDFTRHGNLIRAGQERARANGKKLGGSAKGRKIKRTDELDQTVKTMAASGEPIAKIARVLKLSRPTVYKILNPQE